MIVMTNDCVRIGEIEKWPHCGTRWSCSRKTNGKLANTSSSNCFSLDCAEIGMWSIKFEVKWGVSCDTCNYY
jgi:hypothetical protein